MSPGDVVGDHADGPLLGRRDLLPFNIAEFLHHRVDLPASLIELAGELLGTCSHCGLLLELRGR